MSDTTKDAVPTDEQIFDAARREGVICSAGLLRVVNILLSASKPAAPAQSAEPVAGELEAFEAWFKTSGFWNNAITEKAWRAACAWMRETNAAACDSIVEQSKNSLFRSGAKICAGHIRDGAPEQCDVPPDGWTCSRPKGHTGPCAATQTAVALDDERAASRWRLARDLDASENKDNGTCVVYADDVRALLAASPQPVAQPVEQTRVCDHNYVNGQCTKCNCISAGE